MPIRAGMLFGRLVCLPAAAWLAFGCVSAAWAVQLAQLTQPPETPPTQPLQVDQRKVDPRDAAWAEPVDTRNNLYRIEAGLYRSAQPGPELLPLLQKLGIRTVVNLRQHHSDQALLKDSGIQERRVPLQAWKIEDDQVIAALSAIREAQKIGPVLIHCQHGADRTGVISALYRIIDQGWSRQKALDELQNGGYGFHEIWANIPRYIRRVDIDKVRRRLDGAN